MKWTASYRLNCYLDEPTMTDHIPSRAIGYIRVSTEKQNAGDHALKVQADKIREFCRKRAMKLSMICEDTASSAGAHSDETRLGLQDACRWAKEQDACIVVTEPTRLFRNVEVAERWLDTVSVPVVSVTEDRVLSRSEILSAVSKGEKNAAAVRNATSEAMKADPVDAAKRKASLTAAQQASRKARSRASIDKIHEIASVLGSDPAYRQLSNRGVADLLNRRNVRTGWGRLWTERGVMRQRKEAEALLDEWQEAAREDVPVETVIDPVTSEPVSINDDAEMRKLPTFGVF